MFCFQQLDSGDLNLKYSTNSTPVCMITPIVSLKPDISHNHVLEYLNLCCVDWNMFVCRCRVRDRWMLLLMGQWFNLSAPGGSPVDSTVSTELRLRSTLHR